MPARHARPTPCSALRALALAGALFACGHDATGPRPLRGQLVFMTWEGNGKSAVHVMADTGGAQRALTAPIESLEAAMLSRDGRQVAYAHWNSEIRVYVQDVDQLVGADMSGARTLTPSPYNAQIDPTWSPGDREIAMSDYQKIWVVDAGGGDATPRLAYTSPTPIRNLTWSRDGTRFAFSLGTDSYDDTRIATVGADGTGLRTLTSGSVDTRPSWSPDGHRIAFQRRTSAVGASLTIDDVFVMNDDGTGITRLTSTPGHSSYAPSWSPDGSRIAFGSDRDGSGDVYVMNADGSGQTNLSRSPSIQEIGPISWSPAR